MLLLVLAVIGIVFAAAVYLLAGMTAPILLLPLFLGGFFLAFAVWAIPCIIAAMRIDKEKPMEKQDSVIRWYAYVILNLVICVLRVKLKVIGAEKLPDGPFLFVGNHRSLLDPVAEIYAFWKHKVGFVAKKELFNLAIIGRLMHGIFCLSLNRGTPKDEVRTVLQAISILKSGEACVGIYPEGTRNKGEGLLPFKNGVFKIAQRAECPLVIGVIRNSDGVKKNYPLHRTYVELEVLEVLSPEEIAGRNTADIGEQVRGIMLAGLEK